MTKKNETVTFMSPHGNLSVGLVSSYYKEVNGRHMLVGGKRANFDNQVYQTSDSEEIELLRDNKHNTANGGKLFSEVDVKRSDDIKNEFQAFQQNNRSLEEKEADAQAEADAIEEGSKKVTRKTTAKKSTKKSKAKFDD